MDKSLFQTCLLLVVLCLNNAVSSIADKGMYHQTYQLLSAFLFTCYCFWILKNCQPLVYPDNVAVLDNLMQAMCAFKVWYDTLCMITLFEIHENRVKNRLKTCN